MKIPKARKRCEAYRIELMFNGKRIGATRDTEKECEQWAMLKLLELKTEQKSNKDDVKQHYPLSALMYKYYENVGKHKKSSRVIKISIKQFIDNYPHIAEMSVHELAEMLRTRLLGKRERELTMVFESFGFKHGIPIDADYVFDVRFLPNPHWDPKLRPMTGLDKPVAAFLDRHTEVHNFIYQTRSYLEQWLPMLETNNRSYLTVAIGCTGGKHRSVYIAEQLADYFRSRGKNVQSRHRTLEKRKS